MTFSDDELIKLVNAFNDKLDSYKKEIDDLRTDIYDNFITPAEKNYKDWDHSTRLEEFRGKYPELEGLNESCRAIEADDAFDVVDKVFSDYDSNTDENKPEEAAYVASVVASITEQISSLKEKLGADKVEVESTDDGGVEVKADGEEVAESTGVESATDESATDESNGEEKKTAEPTEDGNDDEDDDFEKEIEEGLKKAERFKL